MQASSPLSPVQDDNSDRNDVTLVSAVKAPAYVIQDVQTELNPRPGQPFLPLSIAPAEIAQHTTSEEHGPKLDSSQEKPVDDATRAPADDALPLSSTPLKKTIPANSSSVQVKISPVPLSYTANAFALAPPSTPPPASSSPADPKQKAEAAEIPETPRVPETPGLSEIDETPSSLTKPTMASARRRGGAKTMSSPSVRKIDTTEEKASHIAVMSTANDDNTEEGSSATAVTGTRTTTRSGRQVVQPKSMQELTPSPPAARAKSKGHERERASAKTTKATRTPQSTKVAGSPAATPAVMRRRKAEAARWKTDSLLSSTRSPLINHDLRSILLRRETWDILSLQEQAEILALFPSMANVSDPGTDAARPNVALLINDNNFRHDCARYKNDLESGFFEREWLAEAFEAHIMRNQGAFDEYVVDEFEKAWGVTVPDSLRSAKSNGEPGNNSVKESTDQYAQVGEDGTAPQKTSSAPTPNAKPAAIKQADPTESIEYEAVDSTTDESGEKATNGHNATTDAPDAPPDAEKDVASEPITAALDSAAPAPISLRLSSPLPNEDGEDGHMAVDTKKLSTGAQPTSPEASDVPGKRKALTTRAQKGKRRKHPSVEAKEINKDNEQGLEQSARYAASNDTLTIE